MNINRNNYELFFIDYLDGNLTDHDILILEDFLLINPDLREELEGTEKIRLTPENMLFKGKFFLKKPDLSLPVNVNNFEDFCVAENELDLSTEQRKGLSDFIRLYPEHLGTVKLFSKLHLLPEKNIIFFQKNKLKKRVALLPRQLFIPVLSVAAAIALMVVIYFQNDEIFNNLPIVSANLPARLSSKAEIEKTKESQPINIEKSESKTQTTSFLTLSENLLKKHVSTIKKGENPLKKGSENKNALPKQRLNPSFQIKLASVTDNQILVPTIEKGKIIYTSSVKPEAINSSEYLSLSEYARKEFFEKVLGKKDRRIGHISGWQIADAGISGINKITGGEMKLEKKIGVDGNITSYSFNSKLLSFSTTSVK